MLGGQRKLAGCVSRGLHGDIMIMIYDETSVHKNNILFIDVQIINTYLLHNIRVIELIFVIGGDLT